VLAWLEVEQPSLSYLGIVVEVHGELGQGQERLDEWEHELVLRSGRVGEAY